MTWDLHTIERSFADAAIEPALWGKAMGHRFRDWQRWNNPISDARGDASQHALERITPEVL